MKNYLKQLTFEGRNLSLSAFCWILWHFVLPPREKFVTIGIVHRQSVCPSVLSTVPFRVLQLWKTLIHWEATVIVLKRRFFSPGLDPGLLEVVFKSPVKMGSDRIWGKKIQWEMELWERKEMADTLGFFFTPLELWAPTYNLWPTLQRLSFSVYINH